MRVEFILSIAILSLTGCAQYYTRSYDLGPVDGSNNNALVMDVKQRSVLSSHIKTDYKDEDGNVTSTKDRIVTCAEPSPDAMSALSASFSGALQAKPEQTIEVANSFSEAASFTGLRTQSIQLLRDGWYRICEGYMSGAIDDDNYELMSRRYQRYMVAILAIEQLTGVVRSQSVTLTTGGKAQVARDIRELTNEMRKVQADLAATKAEKAATEASNKEKIAELDANIARHETTEASLKAAIENSQAFLASTETNAEYSQEKAVSSGDTSRQNMQEIAGIVKEITMSVLEADDFSSMCMARILSLKSGEVLPENISAACQLSLKNSQYGAKSIDLMNSFLQ